MTDIEPSHWIREPDPTIEITRASDLDSRPNAAFELARAPDGLPLVMHVRRAIDVRGPVLRALRTESRLGRDLERALADLERAARAHSVTLRIVHAGDRAYYETIGSVASHLGSTLLARMLGATSPMVLPEDVAAARSSSRDSSRFANSALLAADELDPPSTGTVHREPARAPTAPVTFGRDSRLWLGVSRDTPDLAVPWDASLPARAAAARPLVFESLLAVRSARWHIHERRATPGKIIEGKLSDHDAYRRALASAERLSWSVSRADAVQLVAELARSVDRDWHARRRVHADLKPANVLLQQSGIRAFDAIDVADGGRAAGMTEGWAAYEQILAHPLSPATDVFALSLMVVSALSAAIFGEEQSVVVPAVGKGRRRIKLIKHPEVWLDPKLVELPGEARLAWRALLAQALAFDPAQRPRRGVELADRIDELLARWEVPGRLQVACGPGALDHVIGSRDPVWILHDPA
jgi:hypothetical protein